MGSNRSPLWRKGGVTFGPKPRDYGYAFPQKKRWGALYSALSERVREGAVAVVDDIPLERPSTKALCAMLRTLDLADKKLLLVDDGSNDALSLSARNLRRVRVLRPMALRSYYVVDAECVLFTKRGLETLTKGAPR